MIDDLWDVADAHVALVIAYDQLLSHVPGYGAFKSLWLDIVSGPAEALEPVVTPRRAA